MNRLLKSILLAHRAEDVGSPVEDEGRKAVVLQKFSETLLVVVFQFVTPLQLVFF
jgi:hypothetical protein